MSKHLHFIEHRHMAGDGIKTTFTCKGDRTSPCHQYPPAELEMERWSDKEHGHLYVPHDECLYVLNTKFWDCGELCGPDNEPVRGGPAPVRLWFEECMVWEYINDETTETQS